MDIDTQAAVAGARAVRNADKNGSGAGPLAIPTDSVTADTRDRERQAAVWRDADFARSEAESDRVEIVLRSRSELAARLLNVVIASLALMLLSPVLVFIGFLVKLTSPGPIVYRQIRIGLNRRTNRASTPTLFDRRATDLGGEVFTMYKFRSMRVDAERHTGVVWAQKSDSRVTPIGRVMRATRLDELPQLLNVLKGDMSIVGPRPERPSIFRRLSQEIDMYELRQRARPGITGWAQVNQNYDSCLADVENKVRYDLEYLQRQSVAEDLKIMLKTVPTMLLRRSGW
jgi:lipopolysaccharide/colanic/teichoic acid biosynthesis glycosyltransferase